MNTVEDVKPTILKGCKQGGQVGHRKTTTKGKVMYLHGLGCRNFDNCFECPFPDCRWYS